MPLVAFFQNYPKVLGLNARNLDYVMQNSGSSQSFIANNKLKTKEILKKAGLPVPATYFVISGKKSFEDFQWKLPKSFVLKPNGSLGGQGVLIVYGKKKDMPFWIKAGQRIISLSEIQHHVFNILEGTFSFEQKSDIAIFEERIKLHPVLKPYTFKGGIPDIRVIVYEKIPVMAELRLPTRESEGKSNLHLGGIGVGIDMKTGITTTAIQHNHAIDNIPKTRLILSGIQIPRWKKILEIASRAQESIGIKYLGIDIALDREKGPVILEVNARPGISIQLANQAYLRERLKRIENLKVKTTSRATRLSQELFGGEVEEELEEISGKKVIGIFESVKIVSSQGKTIELIAKIDTGAYRTSLDRAIAEKLKLKKSPRPAKKFVSSLGKEEREFVGVEFNLAGQPIKTEASVTDRLLLRYDMIVGRRDLKNFLIDPWKHRRNPLFLHKET